MTSVQPNALKNLVVFMIVPTIIGIVLALAIYFAVDLPLQQAALHAPANNFQINAR
jgi:hypothetical protein